jgi:hypothetical protein
MRTGDSRRRAAALGILSAPLLIVGFLLISVESPGSDEPAREYVSYFSDNEGQIWIGTILTLLGLAAFLTFLVGGLRDVLVRAAPEGRGLPGLVLAAGTAQALFTLAGVTLMAGTAGAAGFFEGFALDADTARLMIGLSWLPSIYGGIAASVAVAAASLGASRTGALPRAFVRAGFGVSVLLFVAAFIGVAGMLFALWVLAAGVVISRSQAGARPAPTYTQPPASMPV